MWISLAIMVVSALLQMALTPKPKSHPDQNPQPETVTDGTPVLIVFGDVNLSSTTVIWYGNASSKPIRSKGAKK